MDKNIEYVIEPPKKNLNINWAELWRYRNLLLALSWRDISIRYKQTFLGIAWSVFQPFSTTIIFTFIFNRMAKIRSGDGTPYPIFLFIGLLLWQYYSGIIINASTSLLKNDNLIKKIYFPRVIIPSATALTGLVDLIVPLTVLLIMMGHYGLRPSLSGIIIFPLLVLCAMLSALGVGYFLAAVNVKYRDVNHIVPFSIQLLMFVTPVIYPITMLNNYPVIKSVMTWLNPISGIIINSRAVLLGTTPVSWSVFAISLFMSAIYFMAGLKYLLNCEANFADII